MSILSIVFALGLDIALSTAVVMPLVFAFFAKYIEVFAKKADSKIFHRIYNSFQQTPTRNKIYFFSGVGLFVLLLLFPATFTLRGKLDAAMWILTFYPVIVFIYWIRNKTFRMHFGKLLRSLVSFSVVMGLFLSITMFYATFIEAERITTNKVVIDVDDESAAILRDKSIMLISDIHMGPLSGESSLKKLVDKLNSAEYKTEKNKYLLIAGDSIASKYEEATMLYPIAALDESYETYAVLGNHDFNLNAEKSEAKLKIDSRFPNFSTKDERALIGDEVARVYRDSNVEVLRNQSKVVGESFEGHDLVIVGVDDIWSDSYDLEASLEVVKEDDYVVLIGHNPDVVVDLTDDEELSSKVDLFVAGHTHGGELRLPKIPGVLPKGLPLFPLPTKLGYKYDEGYFDYEGKEATVKMFITSGVGETGTRMRLFNPPEVVVFEFE